MAYISAEQVKQIRTELKKQIPQFKLSVVRNHSSTVLISIVEGSVDLGETHKQLNHYYLDKIENKELRELAQKIQDIVYKIRTPEYHETGDYGSQPDFYMNIHVGKWDKPYKIKGK